MELRRTLNLVLPLAISVACVSLCYTFIEIRTERRNLRNELTRRSSIVAENLANSIQSRLMRTLRGSLFTALIQTIFITSLAFILVRWNFIAPLANTAHWLRTLRSGVPDSSRVLPKDEMFAQIHTEARHLAQDLNFARAAAQEE